MIRVKEYLDNNLFADSQSGSELKNNGHHKVWGQWTYPSNYLEYDESPESPAEEFFYNKSHLDHISVNINNETIIVGNICVDGEWSIYHYLQTYEHIPRGEPDKNGYYARSTDEEIIKYIDSYLQKIKKKENL